MLPLFHEASWINFLADFSELPPGVRSIILKTIGDVLFQRWDEAVIAARIASAWTELDLPDMPVTDDIDNNTVR